MKMQLLVNDVIFSSSRVLVSDNCKQWITVVIFYYGKLSYNDKLRMQMLREPGLGEKAIISSYC